MPHSSALVMTAEPSFTTTRLLLIKSERCASTVLPEERASPYKDSAAGTILDAWMLLREPMNCNLALLRTAERHIFSLFFTKLMIEEKSLSPLSAEQKDVQIQRKWISAHRYCAVLAVRTMYDQHKSRKVKVVELWF